MLFANIIYQWILEEIKLNKKQIITKITKKTYIYKKGR